MNPDGPPVLLSDLIPDKNNSNKGTIRGSEALVTSIKKHGVGRGIVVDSKNRVIAGNKTREAAIKAGKKIIVIETTGDELLVNKRVDLDLENDAKARALAIADNRIGQISQDIDLAVVRDQVEQYEIALEEIGYTEEEVVDEPEPGGVSTSGSGSGEGGSVGETFLIVVNCLDDVHQRKTFETLKKLGYDVKCQTL